MFLINTQAYDVLLASGPCSSRTWCQDCTWTSHVDKKRAFLKNKNSKSSRVNAFEIGWRFVSHLEKLLDDFSEEMRQGGRLCNGGIGSDCRSILVALLAVGADESVEQQRQPVPGKFPQHLDISASSQYTSALQLGLSANT